MYKNNPKEIIMAKTGPKPRTREQAWEYLISIADKTVGDCWLVHEGRPIGIGYRNIRAGGHAWYAHHLAYFMTYGQLPFGSVRRHTCDRPNCINPAHIIAGTHADNVADKVAKNRHCKGITHYRCRLTEEQVREIRASSGTYAELGRIYGISRGGIHNIKSGRSWKRL